MEGQEILNELKNENEKKCYVRLWLIINMMRLRGEERRGKKG